MSMTTTDWFRNLSSGERKAIIAHLYELRYLGKLEGVRTNGLMLELLSKLDDDHHAMKVR